MPGQKDGRREEGKDGQTLLHRTLLATVGGPKSNYLHSFFLAFKTNHNSKTSWFIIRPELAFQYHVNEKIKSHKWNWSSLQTATYFTSDKHLLDYLQFACKTILRLW